MAEEEQNAVDPESGQEPGSESEAVESVAGESSSETPVAPAEADAETIDAGEVAAEALASAEDAVASLSDDGEAEASGARSLELDELGMGGEAGGDGGIDLLSDVNLNVKIELGRTAMLVEDVLRLGEGAVVELDKLAGDPVDIYVNDRPVARGEVLVLNDNFCVRVNEILASAPIVGGEETTEGV